MNPIAYNLSSGAGVALAAIGAGAQWGWPVGLLVAGLLAVALSALVLVLAVR